MFRCFYPTFYEKSVYDIDFEKVYEKGFRGLIFDIDNTLVGHDAPADKRAVSFLKELMENGFQVCLLSNNKGPRVRKFNERIGALEICDAKKPSGSGYLRAVKSMGVSKDQILALGDQLFTDIWGANRAEIRSVLVERLYSKETKLIYIKRKLEKIVFVFYNAYRKKHGSSL